MLLRIIQQRCRADHCELTRAARLPTDGHVNERRNANSLLRAMQSSISFSCGLCCSISSFLACSRARISRNCYRAASSQQESKSLSSQTFPIRQLRQHSMLRCSCSPSCSPTRHAKALHWLTLGNHPQTNLFSGLFFGLSKPRRLYMLFWDAFAVVTQTLSLIDIRPGIRFLLLEAFSRLFCTLLP